jgi:hypothetical protein
MTVTVVIARHTLVVTTATNTTVAASESILCILSTLILIGILSLRDVLFWSSWYEREKSESQYKQVYSGCFFDLDLFTRCVPPLSLAMEFPEGCSPCNSRRLMAEQEAEEARNGRQRRH